MLRNGLFEGLFLFFCVCCFKFWSYVHLHQRKSHWWWFFSEDSCIVIQISFQCLMLLMEKAMAPHSSTLAWRIPWTELPGRLQSMGSLRVGHDWATSLSLFTFMHWRGKWRPAPVFLPGESQGRRILEGCCLWGRTESDMTEVT